MGAALWQLNTVQLRAALFDAGGLHEEELARARGGGDRRRAGDVLSALGRRARAQGKLEEARALLGEALTAYRDIEQKWLVVETLYALGELALAEHDPSAATLAREGLAIAQELNAEQEVFRGLIQCARVAAEHGAAKRAVQLMGATEVFVETSRLQTATQNIADLDRKAEEMRAMFAPVAAVCRRVLGEEMFAAAHKAGRALAVDAAVALALTETP